MRIVRNRIHNPFSFGLSRGPLLCVFALSLAAIPLSAQAENDGAARKIQAGRTTGSPAAGNGLAQKTFQPICGTGFSVSDHKENTYTSGPFTESYTCTTPVLRCPSQAHNGLQASVQASAELETLGGDPDSPVKKFRVSYTCTYLANSPPEG